MYFITQNSPSVSTALTLCRGYRATLACRASVSRGFTDEMTDIDAVSRL